jgi:hypothetical protein
MRLDALRPMHGGAWCLVPGAVNKEISGSVATSGSGLHLRQDLAFFARYLFVQSAA